MASVLQVEELRGSTTGANANKIIIPSGQTLDASAGTVVPSSGQVVQKITAHQAYNNSISSGNWTDSGMNPISITQALDNSTLFYRYLIGRAVPTTTGGIAYQVRYSTDGTNYSEVPYVSSNTISAFVYNADTPNMQVQVPIEAKLTTSTSVGTTYYFKIYVLSWEGNAQRFSCNDAAGAQNTCVIEEIAG